MSQQSKRTESPAVETKGQSTRCTQSLPAPELERLRNERDRAKQALQEANKPLRQKEAQPTPLKAHRVWLTLTLFCRRPHQLSRRLARSACAGSLAGHRQGPVPPNRHQLGDAPIGCAHAIRPGCFKALPGT